MLLNGIEFGYVILHLVGRLASYFELLYVRDRGILLNEECRMIFPPKSGLMCPYKSK